MNYLVSTGNSLINNYQKHSPDHTSSSYESLLSFIKEVGEKAASAESHTLYHLSLAENDNIIFLNTQTESVTLCAEVLGKYYAEKKIQSESLEVLGLKDTASSMMENGLRELISTCMNKISEIIHQNEPVAIVATGGFKSESALLTLVGALLDIPVYYIHETFEELVIFPGFPIMPDFSQYRQHLPLLAKLSEGVPVEQMANILKEAPYLQYFVFINKKGQYQTNFAGLMLQYAFENPELSHHLKQKPNLDLTTDLPERKILLLPFKDNIPKKIWQKLESLASMPFIQKIEPDHYVQETGQRRKNRIDPQTGKIFLRVIDAAFLMDIEITTTCRTHEDLIRVYMDLQRLF